MAAIIRPLASVGVAGTTIFNPGTFMKYDSGLWTKGPAVNAGSRGAADHDGHAAAPAVTALRRVVHDLVEAAGDEVDELKLRDGTHAEERGADGRADETGFGDRGVDDPFRAELFEEALGHPEVPP